MIKIKSVILGVIAVFGFVIMSYTIINKDVNPIADPAVYAVLARSLLKYGLPLDIYLPNNPPSVMYPPVFPALWAMILLLFPNAEYTAVRTLVAFFGGLVLILTWFLTNNLNKWARYLIVLNVATNYFFLMYATEFLSEIPYMFFYLSFLLLLKKVRTSIAIATLSGITLALSLLTRTIGLVLVIELLPLAIFLFCNHKSNIKNFKRIQINFFIVILFFIIFATGWIANVIISSKINTYPTHNGAVRTYLDYAFYGSLETNENNENIFLLHVKRLKTNTAIFISTIIDMLFHNYHITTAFLLGNNSIIKKMISTTFILIILMGLAKKISKFESGALYFVAHIFILFIMDISDRQLLPLLPLLYYYLFIGTTVLTKKRSNLIGIVFLSITLIASLFGVIDFIKQQIPTNNAINDYIEGAIWLKQNAEQTDIIMARYPSANYLKSGLKTIGIPLTHDKQKIYKEITTNKIKYIIIDKISSLTEKYLVPALTEKQKSLIRVYNKNSTIIYKVTNIT